MENLEDKFNNNIRINIDQPDGSDIIRDEVWLMATVVKWCFIAVITGAIVGLVAGGFLILLRKAILFIDNLGKYKILMIFPGLISSFFLIKIFAPQSAGHGTEAVIDAFHNKKNTLIDYKSVPIKLIATIITISTGGSVGIEGPCAQIGSGVSFVLGKIFRLDEYDMKKIVICGIASGFCAVFGTPIAGALFAVEVLFVGQIFYDVLLQAFISGIVGYFTSTVIGACHPHGYNIHIPELSPNLLIFSIIGGIFFGCVAIADIEGIHLIKKLFQKFKIIDWKRPIVGAVILSLFYLLFGKDFLGLGSNVIHSMVIGERSIPFGFIIKIFAMGVTLAAGGCGGEITPTLFIGASSGILLSMFFGLDLSFGSALGLVAVLAAATNTPISGTVLAMEFFGGAIAPFAGITCAISYLVVGHRSLYPTQVMLSPKSRTFIIKKTQKGEKLVRRFNSIHLSTILKFYIERAYHKIIRRK